MTDRMHHIFIATPMVAGQMQGLARTLSTGRDALEAAGYAGPMLGPIAGGMSGDIHLDVSVCGGTQSGLAGFFKGAWRRARAVRERINAPVGRLVIPVAGYHNLYPQLWKTEATGRALAPFDAMAAELGGRGRGWRDLLTEIVTELQPEEVILLPEHAGLSEIVAALLPDVDLQLAGGKPARPAPETGVAMLQNLFHMGVTLQPRQVQRLMQFHARLPQPAPIAAFDPLTRARLIRRFDREIAHALRHPRLHLGHAPRAHSAFQFAAE